MWWEPLHRLASGVCSPMWQPISRPRSQRSRRAARHPLTVLETGILSSSEQRKGRQLKVSAFPPPRPCPLTFLRNIAQGTTEGHWSDRYDVF